MQENIIQEFQRRMECRCFELIAEFTQQLDFAGLEKAVTHECAKLCAELLQVLLQDLLNDAMFLAMLKIYAGKKGQRFKEYREITIILSNGQQIKINSPYFCKAHKHHKRKKRGPNGSGAHHGLTVLGFIGNVSPGLLADALQTSLLCPSYEVARTVMQSRGIDLDVKTLRRLCEKAGSLDNGLRAKISLSGSENLHGHTLVISPDGGRLRERRRKRGKVAKHLKRQGFHAEWKEPKLFTIYLLKHDGSIVKEFKPLHDATMEDHEGMFALLERYLRSLPIEQLERVVFCGDGSDWIWNGVKKLCQRMGFAEHTIYQVLDYTHAKQNLMDIVALVKVEKQAITRDRWLHFLWHGEIDVLGRDIEKTVTGKDKLEQAMKKFNNYFAANRERMRYAWFKENGLPRGSGHVESAIRRVINLRLKAPGTFWLKEMAECFLFLRSQLLSGRWEIFMGNLTALTRRDFWAVYAARETS
jgi:hypothetical protein